MSNQGRTNWKAKSEAQEQELEQKDAVIKRLEDIANGWRNRSQQLGDEIVELQTTLAAIRQADQQPTLPLEEAPVEA